jgi:phosphate transport system substrate-binding protein
MGMRLDRRSLVRRAALLGLTAPAFGALLAACGSGNDPTATSAAAVATTHAAGNTAASPSFAATNPAADATTAASPATAAAGPFAPRNVKASLTGSGSSFVDPAMQAWIEQYKDVADQTSINYQSVGSGQGKKDFIGSVTDFGGTDATMTDDELTQAPDALNVPVVLGAVAVTYNLEGVEQLQFSGDTLAKIFLGTINTWNDPAIAADNAGITLPGDTITIVHRSDGSGTTSIFTDYLSKVSAAWNEHVGSGTTVDWPAGIGAEKSPGVTAGVQQTPGAIGYVELIYALGNNLPVAKIKNHAGAFVQPSLDSTSAAAGALDSIPDDLRVSITDPQSGINAYPIAGFSWLLLRSNMRDASKARALTDFIYWALTDGTSVAANLNYAPLPDPVQRLAISKLAQVMVNGEAAFNAP